MVEHLRRRLQADGSVSVPLKVTPRAKRTEWLGVLADGTLKLGVAAVPEGGLANEAVLRFVADEFGVARDRVRVVTGQTSTRKRVAIRLP
jgi:uncharacterized protein YggU (UPF0235/DUF167 family)